MALSAIADKTLLTTLQLICKQVPEKNPDSKMLSIMGEPTACDASRREAEFTFTPEPWMANPFGSVHGGTISTLFDNCMGYLCLAHYLPKMHTVTVNLQVNFLAVAPMDKKLKVICHIDKKGKTLAYISAKLVPEGSEDPVATATSVYYIAS